MNDVHVGSKFNQEVIRRRIDDLLSKKTKPVQVQKKTPKPRSGKGIFQDNAESLKEMFIRIIRDGAADEIKNTLLETQREIEQHTRLDRASKESIKLARDFDRCSQHYIQKKILLEKLEKTLDQFRAQSPVSSVEDVETLSKLDSYINNANKIRDDIIQDVERILKIKDRLDQQIEQDRETMEGLQETLKRCLAHLPSKERGKLEVQVRSASEGKTYEEKIHILTSVIERLAQSVPAIRREEITKQFEQARKKYEQKKYQEAMKFLDQVFQFDRKHLEAHRLRAKIFHHQKNRLAYISELRMITGIKEARADDFFTLATVLEEGGQIEDAFPLYKQAVQRDPNSQYLERIGDCCRRLKKWKDAISYYRQLIQQHSPEPMVYHKLAHTLYDAERLDESFEALRRAIRKIDTNAHSRLLLARLYRRSKLLNKAEESFAKAAKLDPENDTILYSQASFFYDRGEFQQALEIAETILQRTPDHMPYRLLAARCLGAQGKISDGLERLSPLLSDDQPTVDVLLAFSSICRENGQVNRALEILEETLKRFPWQPQLRSEYGLLLIHAGKMKAALDYLNPNPYAKNSK